MNQSDRQAMALAMYTVEHHVHPDATFTRATANAIRDVIEEPLGPGEELRLSDVLGDALTQMLKLCAQQEVALRQLETKIAER